MKKYGIIDGFAPSTESLEHFWRLTGEKDVETSAYKSLSDALLDIKNNRIDYLIVPSRTTLTNEVNIILMDIIERINYAKVCEIHTFVDYKTHLTEKQNANFNDAIYFGNSVYEKTNHFEHIKENERNYIEYKVFEKNKIFDKNHKKDLTRRWYRTIYTTTTGLFVGRILVFLSIVASIILLILGLLNFTNGKTTLELASSIITLSTIIFKFFEHMLRFSSKCINGMITGYWIYYSFEREYVSGNYVPRGFTARALEISYVNKCLVFTCHIEGNDSVFFSTSDNHFSFSVSDSIGVGSYHYVSNFINSNGLRAEGVCSFFGHAEKKNKIINMDGWFSGRGTGIKGSVKYVRVSKEQFNFLKMNGFPDRSQSFLPIIKIGVYGEAKSNTDVALDYCDDLKRIISGKMKITKAYYSDLNLMVHDLNIRRIDACIIPVNNNLSEIRINNESPKEVFDCAIKSKQSIVEVLKFDYSIDYCVCSNKHDYKINEHTRFISNPNSLNQCWKYIGCNPKKEVPSTSYAAKEASLKLIGDNDVVICNKHASAYYNLYVLDDNILKKSKIDNNITTFAIYFNKEFDKAVHKI